MAEEVTATPNLEEPKSDAGLSIQDLTSVLHTIQIASSRGAFRAEELSTVGGLFDRIFKFLEAAGAVSKNPPKESE